ncbi:MAG TPA: hypothetical protein VII18_22325 [Mycobacterium sp.]
MSHTVGLLGAGTIGAGVGGFFTAAGDAIIAADVASSARWVQ